MKTLADYIKANENRWNDRVKVHLESDFYDMDHFRQSMNSLKPIETALLGDVRGKSILHLQCHFGQDTLSLAKMGANVTGVDFSASAIEVAQKLSHELDLTATFIQSDVLELEKVVQEQFDIVFTSYGVLGWLPDMNKWAKQLTQRMKAGGKLILVEFHPMVWMFDSTFKRIAYSYFNTGPIIEETTGTYTDREAGISGEEVSWSHSLGDVLGALLQQGLTINHFQEYDYSPWNCFDDTVACEGGFQIPGLEGKLPMVFSVVAGRPA